MSQMGLGGNQQIVFKLFNIFDEDGNNSINYKELMVGMLILRNSPMQDKIKEFVMVCESENGSVPM